MLEINDHKRAAIIGYSRCGVNSFEIASMLDMDISEIDLILAPLDTDQIYIDALHKLKNNNILAGSNVLLNCKILNLYIVDYTLSRNKLMEDIRGIVGDEFLVDYLSNIGEIIIKLKK